MVQTKEQHRKTQAKHRKTVAGKATAKRWYINRRLFIDSLKQGQPCIDCGIEYPPYVMDFDHRTGEDKLFNIGNAPGFAKSKTKLLAEVAKCDIVCANCHRERTYGESPRNEK